MRKYSLILFLIPFIVYSFKLPEVKSGNWWTVKFKPRPYSSHKKISEEKLLIPDYIMKFTILNEDSSEYIIEVEATGKNLQGKEVGNFEEIPKHKIYINKKKISLVKLEKFISKRNEKGLISYSNGSYEYPFMGSDIIAFIGSWQEMFTVPKVLLDKDSIYITSDSFSSKIPEEEKSQREEVTKEQRVDTSSKLNFTPPVKFHPYPAPTLQKLNKGYVSFEGKQLFYKEISLIQSPDTVKQVWIDRFPWWIIHESKPVKAEVIESSYYTKEELEKIKALIREDLKKKGLDTKKN